MCTISLWMYFLTSQVDLRYSTHHNSCKLDTLGLSNYIHVHVLFVHIIVLNNNVYRRHFFDGPQQDPNYVPLPEDRPGGYAWGEGRQLHEQEQQEQQQN